MPTLDMIRQAVCQAAMEYPVKRVELFGSYANGTADADSDVDFLVEFNDGASLFDQGAIQAGLHSILGHGVDVVDSDALSREPFFAYAVRKDMVPL